MTRLLCSQCAVSLPSAPGVRSWSATGLTLGWVLLAALLWAGLCGSAARAADTRPEKLVRSDDEAVRFSIAALAPSWSEYSLRGGTRVLHDLRIEGFTTYGAPGRPRLPRQGGWLLVPPGTRPELRVIAERWEDAGARPLMVGSTPVLVRDPATGEVIATSQLLLPGEQPRGDGEIPAVALQTQAADRSRLGEAAVTLGEIGTWRGRRVVSYTIVPLQADTEGRAVRQLVDGTWEVRFVADPTAATRPPRPYRSMVGGRNDERFGFMFLNGALLQHLPTEASAGGWTPAAAADKAGPLTERGGRGTLLGPELKLPVRNTKLLRVVAGELANFDHLPAGILESQVRLYQRRYLERLDDGSGQPPWVDIEVPIHMVGDGGEFSGGDFFIFYGLRLRDDQPFTMDVGDGPEEIPGSGDSYEMNNDDNLYWLAFSEPDLDESWARMTVATLPAAAAAPLPYYQRTDHFEDRYAYRENVPNQWVDRVYSTDFADAQGSLPLIFWSPRPDGPDVQLEVTVAGFSNSTRTLNFSLERDDQLVFDLEPFTFASRHEQTMDRTIPASLLTESDYDLRILPAIPPRLWAFVNWAEVTYEALYRPLNDKLTFNGGSDALADIEVTGFTTDDLGLVDITDLRHPIFISLAAGSNVVSDDAGGFKLSLRADQSAGSRTFYGAARMTSNGVGEVPYFQIVQVTDPVNPTTPAVPNPELIVITHPEFSEAIVRWVEHRQSRDPDLAVHAVEVQDIFDWYNGGLKDPWAIKRFVNHALGQWQSYALQIVGDGNENVLELRVGSTGRAWSKDWVPTHLHDQFVEQQPELLGSDKWYAHPGAVDQNYPTGIYEPADMYVARFACNSVDDLNVQIDKVITVETVQPDETWRRRGIFMADDAWSGGYSGWDGNLYYDVHEHAFQNSQRDPVARNWRENVGVALEADTLFLQLLIDPHFDPDMNPRPWGLAKEITETYGLPPLLAAIDQGATIVHFQGHGNQNVLCHEYWIQDKEAFNARHDVASFTNTGKPFVFYGMGCHIGDWMQNPAGTSLAVPQEMSLCEKMVSLPGAGAVAAYGSSGFEYRLQNIVFSEKMLRRWMLEPPTTSVDTTRVKSRWVLGELTWASESDILASNSGDYLVREMVQQYVLLGDVLMSLNCGAPEADAVLVGDPDQDISGTVDLVAVDASNQRMITLAARDEAGIDRILVRDNGGADLTGSVVTSVSTPDPDPYRQQLVDYELSVPVRPFDHNLTVDLFDTGSSQDTDHHYRLTLNIRQTATFYVAGEEVVPEEFVFRVGDPVVFTADVFSAAWLSDASQLALTGVELTLTDVQFNLDKNNQMQIVFTAVATGSAEIDRGVVLAIDGYETTYILQSGSSAGGEATISEVHCFPNPAATSTRIVYRTGASQGDGKVMIYTVAGRTIAVLPFSYSGSGSGVVNWDVRDNEGDNLANGVYLYRVLLDTPEGHLSSPMQRLVVMQ